MNPRVLLGVNIDHVATLRQARGTRYPDPVQAALVAEEAGADGITIHPREDRRHIQDRDVLLLKEVLQTKMHLEMAVTDAMLAFAAPVRPECVPGTGKAGRADHRRRAGCGWPGRPVARARNGWRKSAQKCHCWLIRTRSRLTLRCAGAPVVELHRRICRGRNPGAGGCLFPILADAVAYARRGRSSTPAMACITITPSGWRPFRASMN